MPIAPIMSDKVEALERLAKLADQGLISEEEYRSLKNEVLGNDNSQDEVAQSVLVSASPQSDNARPDMYEVALQEGVRPDKSGWFPDPENLGTHMRFHNGTEWTGSSKLRTRPGWYASTVNPSRQRYFDGLEFTHEFRYIEQSRATPARPTTVPTRPIAIPKDWKFWVGAGLMALGALALIVTAAMFIEDTSVGAGVLLFNIAIHPLIWGGVVGAFLLDRRKRKS